ncbi:hypothetical protein EV182_001203 [Spiromyces aspiralis]|uniref:Uncharacterized protein n=1 Tax=Spiromyces aspiralis TaxID=68401 RepID=A0ACC1HU58_9FUNG|nr:hypothetical protein EV182_001203 [Spiromyces aspiralis]
MAMPATATTADFGITETVKMTNTFDLPGSSDAVFFTYTQELTGITLKYEISAREVYYGNTVEFFRAFNCISLICSAAIIAIVLTLFFNNPAVARRPSIRLSGWMAVTDIVVSSIQLARMSYPFFNRQTTAAHRVSIWLTNSMYLVFTFLTTCVTIHLMLTVLLRKQHLANKISRHYELVSFVLGIGLGATIFHYTQEIVWDPIILTTHYLGSKTKLRDIYMICEFIWEIPCIAYCIIVSLLISLHLWPIFARMRVISLTMPEDDTTIVCNGSNKLGNAGGVSSGCHPLNNGCITSTHISAHGTLAGNSNYEYMPLHTPTKMATSDANSLSMSQPEITSNITTRPSAVGFAPSVGMPYSIILGRLDATPNMVSYASKTQRKHIKRTIQRILLYPIQLIVFRVPYMCFYSTLSSSLTLNYCIYTIIALQGVINFVVFLLNPTLEQHFYPWIKSKIGSVFHSIFAQHCPCCRRNHHLHDYPANIGHTHRSQ